MDMLWIVVLVILAGFGLHGYLKGLVRVLFSFVAIFLAIGLAAAFTPYTAKVLRNQTPLYDTVKEQCAEHLRLRAEEGSAGAGAASDHQKQDASNSENPEGAASREQKDSENPEGFNLQKELTVLGMKVPQELQNLLSGNLADQTNELLEESGVYEKIGDYVAEQVIQRLAWILTFAVILILLFVAVHMLDLIAKLPVLNGINRLGGLAIGLAEGLLVVWIFFLAVSLCQGSAFGIQMLAEIQGNFFLKFLYDNNMIEQLLMRR